MCSTGAQWESNEQATGAVLVRPNGAFPALSIARAGDYFISNGHRMHAKNDLHSEKKRNIHTLHHLRDSQPGWYLIVATLEMPFVTRFNCYGGSLTFRQSLPTKRQIAVWASFLSFFQVKIRSIGRNVTVSLALLFFLFSQIQHHHTHGYLHAANAVYELYILSCWPRTVGQSKHRRVHCQANGKHQIQTKSIDWRIMISDFHFTVLSLSLFCLLRFL